MPRSSLLSYETPGLEQRFSQQRAVQLLPQDEAWALFNLLFGLAGLGKWAQRAEWPPWAEALSILAWTAWGPLHVYLIRSRRGWYLRHRNAFVVVMRMSRWMLSFNDLPAREDLWVGRPGAVPSTTLAVYTHLCWKVNFLLVTAFGVVLPMRLFLPCQLVAFLLSLRATLMRCRQECGLSAAGAAAAAAAAAAGCSGAGSSFEGSSDGGAGVCTVTTVADVRRYYAGTRRLIRSLGPGSLWRLADRWTKGRQLGASCAGACFAAHSWLQATGGVLLPTVTLWLWEERLRYRELQLVAVARQERAPLKARPLHAATALLWLAASAWLLWFCLETMLL